MNEIPNVVSTKDLAYIEDMLNWNLIVCKKINSLCDRLEDKEVKELLCKTSHMHKEHYKQLLGLIE